MIAQAESERCCLPPEDECPCSILPWRNPTMPTGFTVTITDCSSSDCSYREDVQPGSLEYVAMRIAQIIAKGLAELESRRVNHHSP